MLVCLSDNQSLARVNRIQWSFDVVKPYFGYAMGDEFWFEYIENQLYK